MKGYVLAVKMYTNCVAYYQKLRRNSEILFNIILCYCSLGYIRYKRKVDNAVDM